MLLAGYCVAHGCIDRSWGTARLIRRNMLRVWNGTHLCRKPLSVEGAASRSPYSNRILHKNCVHFAQFIVQIGCRLGTIGAGTGTLSIQVVCSADGRDRHWRDGSRPSLPDSGSIVSQTSAARSSKWLT